MIEMERSKLFFLLELNFEKALVFSDRIEEKLPDLLIGVREIALACYICHVT
jgi:hypothetical protein